MRTSRRSLALLLLAVLNLAHGKEPAEILREHASFATPDGNVRVKLGGLLDGETYWLPSVPPGLLFTDDSFLFNPRLTLFLDGQLGSRVYFFAQARLDRGFDPSEEDLEMRLDEYALRFTPWEDGRFNFQIGQFATVFGGYVERHLSWDNPFINAPLAYENLTGIWDDVAVKSAGQLLAWSHVPTRWRSEFGDGYYDKHLRLPIIWGPSYASGASVTGKLGKFEYAVEIKNSGLASSPEAWGLQKVNMDQPVFGGRLGYRPNMAWNLGVSANRGPYLLPKADASVPAGKGIEDYDQLTIGHDFSFHWRHFQLWGEVIASRFEVPTVGDADTLAYHLEAKYKFTPQLFGAVRWNQQFFANSKAVTLPGAGTSHDSTSP